MLGPHAALPGMGLFFRGRLEFFLESCLARVERSLSLNPGKHLKYGTLLYVLVRKDYTHRVPVHASAVFASHTPAERRNPSALLLGL